MAGRQRLKWGHRRSPNMEGLMRSGEGIQDIWSRRSRRGVFRQVTVFLVLLAAASQSAIGADESRRWPNEFGEIIGADLVMVRSKDVVLRPQPYPGKLVVVPFDKLRPVDQRYLHLERRRRTR